VVIRRRGYQRGRTIMSDPFNPPAVVRPAADLKALAAKIKDDYVAHLDLARKSLERAIAIGLALCEVKKACGHGNWLTWLEENVPFGRERAADFMRVALNKAKCGHLTTFEEALRFLAEAERNASASPPAPADEPPPDIAEGHGDAHEPPEDRQPHAGEGEPTYTPRPRPRPRRSPNDPMNGEVVFTWHDFYARFGALYREIDRLGNAYGLIQKDTPEKRGLFRRLVEFKEDFKRWYRQLSKQKPPED
jgi:hypothetical protein